MRRMLRRITWSPRLRETAFDAAASYFEHLTTSPQESPPRSAR